MALTAKQRAFIEAYQGNGTEAARAAGYKGSDATLAQVASENLRKPEVRAALDARLTLESVRRIATRQERQEFWTSTMRDPEASMLERLRASELLGKSEADFVERVEAAVETAITIEAHYPAEDGRG